MEEEDSNFTTYNNKIYRMHGGCHPLYGENRLVVTHVINLECIACCSFLSFIFA